MTDFLPKKKPSVDEPVSILVVDDDATTVEVIHEALFSLNEHIVHARSGKEALKNCLDHEYAVILLDVYMPEMDGFETASLLRQNRKTAFTPIIFVTGIAENYSEILKGYAEGAVDYLVKPFNADILRAKVQVFVDLFRMRVTLAKEVSKRRSVEEQQLALEDFVFELRSGNIDTIVSNDKSKKVIHLLDQSVIEKNSRLMSELQLANQDLQEGQAALKKQKEMLLQANDALERKTHELQRTNQELDDFNHLAGHDLREPLRTMSNYCDLLRDDIKLQAAERIEQDIHFIRQAAQRMTTLIDDLLLLARTKRSIVSKKSVDLNVCLNTVLEQMELCIQEKHAVIECPQPLPTVVGDVSQITRVMQNLIHNGIKFQLPGAVPHLCICTVSSPLSDDFCRLSFQDNGIGIGKNYHEKIFGAFQRLQGGDHYHGSGIGLAVVKSIVEHHGGQIKVESDSGKGSCFILDLPRTSDDVSSDIDDHSWGYGT